MPFFVWTRQVPCGGQDNFLFRRATHAESGLYLAGARISSSQEGIGIRGTTHKYLILILTVCTKIIFIVKLSYFGGTEVSGPNIHDHDYPSKTEGVLRRKTTRYFVIYNKVNHEISIILLMTCSCSS